MSITDTQLRSLVEFNHEMLLLAVEFAAQGRTDALKAARRELQAQWLIAGRAVPAFEKPEDVKS
jgi:hypothetical protein